MDDHALAGYFADLARRLLEVDGVQETMDLLVLAAVDAVDACEHASISHQRGRSLISASHDDVVAVTLDGVQTGAGEGPCLDAIRTGEIIVVGDLTDDERWPTYGPRAVESTGVRSSLGYPLHDGQRVIGALNLFSSRVDAFDGDPEQEGIVAVVAAHATSALAAALHRHDMAAALANRDVIGQAKGFLMARSGLDEDAAFDVLVRASQRTNVKLAEVARRLVRGEAIDHRSN